jgi:SRSO17 transposase
VETDVARGVVLADAAYGTDSEFRTGLTELKLEYIVGVPSSSTLAAGHRIATPQSKKSGL